ncbi:MAG: UDP-2,3-diacylglucosamine diphosphatase [Rhodothermales bacterium]
MYLFLSDLHLGRGTAAESRAAERDALALLRAHESDVRPAGGDGGLFLVGDVFDQFIEYRRLVPKGFVRLQGLLAEWTDAGVPVTYVVGNRDPWHLDYFERELGVRVVPDGVAARLAGRETYIAHGDGLVPTEQAYNRLKPLLRHPVPYRLYRNLFPGDWGYRLARHIARRGSGAPDAPTVDALRDAARRRLTGPTDLVVFGHGHRAERIDGPGGTYLNPGYWFADRTFARLDAAGPALLRWTAGEARPLDATEYARHE